MAPRLGYGSRRNKIAYAGTLSIGLSVVLYYIEYICVKCFLRLVSFSTFKFETGNNVSNMKILPRFKK